MLANTAHVEDFPAIVLSFAVLSQYVLGISSMLYTQLALALRMGSRACIQNDDQRVYEAVMYGHNAW